MRTTAAGCLWLLAVSMAIPGRPDQSVEGRPLLEAVIRYEIEQLLRPPRTAAAGVKPFAFCVQIRATARAEPVDPDVTLLARFKDHLPPVKPGSECTVRDWKVYDKSSGQAAVILDFGPVVHRNPSEAEVSGAPYLGGQVARELRYRLKRTGQKWSVYDVEVVIQA